jgi:hypothetical protein
MIAAMRLRSEEPFWRLFFVPEGVRSREKKIPDSMNGAMSYSQVIHKKFFHFLEALPFFT